MINKSLQPSFFIRVFSLRNFCVTSVVCMRQSYFMYLHSIITNVPGVQRQFCCSPDPCQCVSIIICPIQCLSERPFDRLHELTQFESKLAAWYKSNHVHQLIKNPRRTPLPKPPLLRFEIVYKKKWEGTLSHAHALTFQGRSPEPAPSCHTVLKLDRNGGLVHAHVTCGRETVGQCVLVSGTWVRARWIWLERVCCRGGQQARFQQVSVRYTLFKLPTSQARARPSCPRISSTLILQCFSPDAGERSNWSAARKG